MTRPLTLVHAADLHLDSPLSGVPRPRGPWAELVRDASFLALDEVCDLARRERADLVVLAGDLFDSSTRSLRARLRLRQRLGALAEEGIPSFLAFGNHDPAPLWEGLGPWPEGVHAFPAEAVEAVELAPEGGPRVTVYGRSHPGDGVTENLAAGFRRGEAPGLHVAVLHAHVGGRPGHQPYAPCALADLVAAGMDYWALGHVHAREVLREADPCVVYPGNTQGRHLGEAGPRGCALVRLREGATPEVEWRETAAARFEEVEVELGPEVVDLVGLAGRLRAGLAAAGQGAGVPVAARVTLTGATELDATLRAAGELDELVEELAEDEGQVALAGLRLATRPVGGSRLERDLADELEALCAQARDPEVLAELGAELDELWADPRLRRVLPSRDPDRVAGWLEEAAAELAARLAGSRRR